MHNPALREEPRYQPAPVSGTGRPASMLAWLESTGRLVAKEIVLPDYGDEPEDLNDLMVGDDDYIDIDEEDDDVVVDDEDEDLI